MDNDKVNHVLEEISSWSEEEKVMLLERLTKETSNIEESKDSSSNPIDKTDLLNKLCGAWADTSEDLAKEILESRTISDKNISFD